MKLRTMSLLTALLLLPVFFVSTQMQHGLMAMPMPDMMNDVTNTKINDCISACGSQYQSTVTAINQRELEKEKEPKPAPAEPYYLQFLQFAPVLVLISAAYLLRHLRWRPPDLFKLYSVYRI